MPASVFRYCAACSGEHELILFSADRFDPDATYEYTCPSTAHLVRIQMKEWARITNVKRPEAVAVVFVDGE